MIIIYIQPMEKNHGNFNILKFNRRKKLIWKTQPEHNTVKYSSSTARQWNWKERFRFHDNQNVLMLFYRVHFEALLYRTFRWQDHNLILLTHSNLFAISFSSSVRTASKKSICLQNKIIQCTYFLWIFQQWDHC